MTEARLCLETLHDAEVLGIGAAIYTLANGKTLGRPLNDPAAIERSRAELRQGTDNVRRLYGFGCSCRLMSVSGSKGLPPLREVSTIQCTTLFRVPSIFSCWSINDLKNSLYVSPYVSVINSDNNCLRVRY